jgi:hypothetical protein
MPEADLFAVFLERLNTCGSAYMVTGSVASIIYGEPRLTHDIDIVLELHSDQVPPFLKAFPETQFYCPPQEVIQTEVGRETRGHFNLIHLDSGFKADIYPIGKDPLHRWAMQNRRLIEFRKIKVWVAAPEYVILRKLEYFQEGGSPKHLRDIEAMCRISQDIIDKSVLRSKASDLGLDSLLDRVPGL